MYYEGKGVPQDFELAFQWYKKSSEKGTGEASNMVGMMYWMGNGVQQSNEDAVEWFEKGAEQGCAAAQNNLGYCHENGYGVEVNGDNAIYWYDKALQQGDSTMKTNLAKICYRMGSFYYGQNSDSAFYFYKKSADLGNDKAQFKLGRWYEKGIDGIEKDMDKANHYYELAADNGNLEAHSKINPYLYERYMNYGDLVSLEKAAKFGYLEAQNELFELYKKKGDFTLLEKAAEFGNREAQFELGNHYYNGENVEKDYIVAYEWYKKASRGYEKAAGVLDDYFETIVSKMTDHTEMVGMLTQAAEKGYAEAQFELGNCYYNGIGVKQDYGMAKHWHHAAAEQHFCKACFFYANCFTERIGYFKPKSEMEALLMYDDGGDRSQIISYYSEVIAGGCIDKNVYKTSANKFYGIIEAYYSVGGMNKEKEAILKTIKNLLQLD